jgi:ketosteroid isomerase-like protein
MRNFKMGLKQTCPVVMSHRTHFPVYRLFSILLFLLIPLASWSQHEAVIANEHLRFQAQINRDTSLLAYLLHDDLYYLHSNGLAESKADFMASVGSAKIVYQEMIPRQQKIRRYGKTALLTGLLQVSGLYEGSPFDVELYYTSVYLKKKGSWYLVSWQSTGKK